MSRVRFDASFEQILKNAEKTLKEEQELRGVKARFERPIRYRITQSLARNGSMRLGVCSSVH